MSNEEHIIDNVLIIPVLSKGDKLYHYTSGEGLKGICEGEFWATERSFLNDYTEFQVATDIFIEILEKHMNNQRIFTKLKEKIFKELDRLQTPSLNKSDQAAYAGDYVISFSLDSDSPLMWSEYSDFTGYCMEFDFFELWTAFNKFPFNMHGKVIYEHDEQIRLVENSIEYMMNQYEELDYLDGWDDLDKMSNEEIDGFVSLMAMVITGYNMFFKLPCFEGENEYRFVISRIHDGGICKPEDRVPVYFRLKNGVLIPYVKEKIQDVNSLKRVLVGAKNGSDIAAIGLKHFFRSKGLYVDVEKSQMPLRY